MPLPSSGPLALTDIQTEFGGSNPISLSEYYAGGANVPAGTTGTYGAVPSSGAISIRNFYGTTKVIISITGQNIGYSSGGLTSATAGYQLTNGGLVRQNEQNNYSTLEQWCTPTSQATNYEVYATLVYGTVYGDPTGAWLLLTNTREWLVTASTGGYEQAQITVQIRRTGTTTPVYGPVTITITADAIL